MDIATSPRPATDDVGVTTGKHYTSEPDLLAVNRRRPDSAPTYTPTKTTDPGFAATESDFTAAASRLESFSLQASDDELLPSSAEEKRLSAIKVDSITVDDLVLAFDELAIRDELLMKEIDRTINEFVSEEEALISSLGPPPPLPHKLSDEEATTSLKSKFPFEGFEEIVASSSSLLSSILDMGTDVDAVGISELWDYVVGVGSDSEKEKDANDGKEAEVEVQEDNVWGEGFGWEEWVAEVEGFVQVSEGGLEETVPVFALD